MLVSWLVAATAACGRMTLASQPQNSTSTGNSTHGNVPAGSTGGTTGSAVPTTPTAPAPPTIPTPPVVPMPPATYAGETTLPYTFVGRFDFTNPNAPVCSLLGSRIGASFTGTSLTAQVLSMGTNLFNVVIDRGGPIVITAGPNTDVVTVPIASNLSDGNHTVWLTKRTEFLQGAAGAVQFFGFGIDSNAVFLAPPREQQRRIEFSGDSGFTGYGVDKVMTGNADACSYSVQTQNADKSIPAYAGALLNADIINDSSSGQAVYASVYDGNPNHLLPFMFNETTPVAQTPLWAFNLWTPDVVVLDAGGDDLAGYSGSGAFPNEAGFVADFEKWVAFIRTQYPRATVILVLSQSAADSDITTLGGALQQVVTNFQNTGDPNVIYYDYFANDPNYTTYDQLALGENVYWGCSYHPSAAGSRILAQRLATFIASKMGW